mgnify:CR=1 FL=1
MNSKLHDASFIERRNPITSRAYQPPGNSVWVRMLALIALPLIVVGLGIRFLVRLVLGRDDDEK